MVLYSGENMNSLGTGEIRSTADLDGKNVGVAKNSTTRDDMIEFLNTMSSDSVNPMFFEYASYEAMFKALKDGTIDVMSVDVSILNNYVDNETQILDDRFAGQNYGAAVLPEHAALLTYINQAISDMS
jgi:putative glutamine transport system substrate-binding protein